MKNKLEVKIGDVRTCNHGDNMYSLSLKIKDTQVSIYSFPYSNGGINTDIDIFDLTPELMYELAEKIVDQANQIRKDGIL